MRAESTDQPSVARTLAEVAHVLSAGDRADARVKAALNLVRQMVPYERCALLEVVPKNGKCELFTVPELPNDTQAALRARLTKLLRLMGDEGCDQKADATPVPPPPSERVHLAIPVIGLSHIIGVLFVEQVGAAYDEHSLRLLSVVAAQLGSYLTTVRLREEELEHARQLGVALQRLQETDRRKDEFLAMLGHELRNPLGAINSALRIIDHRKADELGRYHKVIDRQITHLSRIVDDLLDASRVRLGKITLEHHLVDLSSVARRWLEAFGTTGEVLSHDVTLDAPEAPVMVDGDPVRLEQIFSNLLTNALKYTPQGGQIRVSIALEGKFGVLRIRDTGIGMAPGVIPTVFELFTQADESLARSQGGLGLGLPLVRSLVEKHGGTVEAFSQGAGQGSEFVVRLPVATEAKSSRKEDGVLPPPVRQGEASLRILIVEDNADAAEMLQEMLLAWEHRVTWTSDGLAGLAEALANPYDVLLVDIGLPKLDGYEIARRLRRELGERTPMLFAMTGYGQPEDRRRAIDSGFDAHMVKPLNAFELKARLAKVASPALQARGGQSG